jgi:hypothetical protein
VLLSVAAYPPEGGRGRVSKHQRNAARPIGKQYRRLSPNCVNMFVLAISAKSREHRPVVDEKLDLVIRPIHDSTKTVVRSIRPEVVAAERQGLQSG